MQPSSFSPEVAEAAAKWLTLSMDAGFGPHDAERLQQWRNADPEHERAWLHIEGMSASLHRLNPHAAYQTLSRLHAAGRRSTLKALAWLGLVAGSGVLASRTEQWRLQVADYSSGTGELKTIELSDGTQIILNTRSAIDVELTDTARTVTLLNGEVMVTTGHQPGEHRPFRLLTAHGSISPLGTRFNVRLAQDSTHVIVLEGSVDIAPRQGKSLVMQAGQQSAFTEHDALAASAAPAQAGSWSKGLLFVNDMRLADLVQELARYRPGFIHCDADVADLKISGVFTLNDTTQALESLPNSLPVSIAYRTRYWARISASHAG